MKIFPAILTDKRDELERMFEVSSGFCDFVQVDIMDGKFVPTFSVSPGDVAGIDKKIPYEAHIMVEDPLNYVEPFKKAGAERIIFHFESKDGPEEVIKKIRQFKMSPGLAINPQTPLKDIERFLPDLDLVLVMSVVPGFYGSKFVPETVEKITQLKNKGGNFLVAMDGGIKSDNIKMLRDKGLDIACVGSAVFKGDPKENFKALTEQVK